MACGFVLFWFCFLGLGFLLFLCVFLPLGLNFRVSPFTMIDLRTPHTWRPYSRKKTGTGNWEQGIGGASNWGQDLGQETGNKDLRGGRESCTRESQMIRDQTTVVFGQFEISTNRKKQFYGGALLCFKKPEALLCVVESVFC